LASPGDVISWTLLKIFCRWGFIGGIPWGCYGKPTMVGFKDPFEWKFGRTNTETFCCEKHFLFVAMLPLADVSVSYAP